MARKKAETQNNLEQVQQAWSSKPKTPRNSNPRKTPEKRPSPSTGSSTPATRPSYRLLPTVRIKVINARQKALLGGIFILFLTVVLVLSQFSINKGQLPLALFNLLAHWFGWGAWFVPFASGGVGLYLVFWGIEQPFQIPTFRIVGGSILFLVFEALAAMTAVVLDRGADVLQVASAGSGGGYLGGFIAYTLINLTGNIGTIFTLTVLGGIAAIITSGATMVEVRAFIQRLAGVTAVPATTATPPDQPTTQPVNPRSIRLNPNRGAQPVASPSPTTAVAPSTVPGQQIPLPLNGLTKTPLPAEPEAKNSRKSKKGSASDPTPAPIVLGTPDPNSNWKLPAIAELLESGTDHDVNSATIREQVEVIEHTLESFGAPATVVEINQGPTITQFGVEPNFVQARNGKRTKVKVGKIASLSDDLALALAAKSIRMQAPVPGKGYVGIEVPNPAKAMVSLRDVMEAAEFQKIKSPLRIGLGQNVAGQPVGADLAAMPHMLIAGTTGSGKSVCVNGIIACLILQNTPDSLKLVMIDPKRVELTGYNGIPHLALPVVVDMEKVLGTLQWALREMDSRYKMFAEVGARNIIDYNKKIKGKENTNPFPYVVIIIDELADLMMMAPEDTERAITRLAQMARATGIHMVIATQRPSVDVVTGLIKANFPARIAFAVASSTDSRVVLDSVGAERLLGQGDMLFQSPDAAAPVRLQGCYVSDGELQRLIAYWQTSRRLNVITPDQATPKPTTPLVAGTTATTTAAKLGATAVGAKPLVAATPPTSSTAINRPASTPTVAPVKVVSSPNAAPAQVVPPSLRAENKMAPLDPKNAIVLPRQVDGATPPPIPKLGETRPTPPPAKPVSSAPPPQIPVWQGAAGPVSTTPEGNGQYEDELLPEATALVYKLKKASTSLLQRHFRIGYTRAARLIDLMEQRGIIGPPTGTSKARELVLWENGAPVSTDPEKENS